MSKPHISVICTVLNEGDAIRRLLDSLAAQTRPADEIVIVDGGSRDNTVRVIQEYVGRLPLKVLVEPGANISRGRNVAIAAAQGEIIASTDAGVWLEPQWLERLVSGFGFRISDSLDRTSAEQRNPQSAISNPQCVAGFFLPDPHTTFEIAMGATVLPALEDINPERFLPSSRSVAFTKAAWAAAGGYPEWLDYCEDLIFDFRLREVAGPFAWAPEAIAHFRPRGTFRAFFKQYYRYARGDGKADLWRVRHAIRYGTYLVALPGLLALSILHHPLWLLALGAGVLAYCRTPYRRLRRYLPGMAPLERVKAVLLVPLIRAVGDIAKMLGYPAGWAWRLRNWRRSEIHWRRAGPSVRKS
ncbi:MAG: glycosyltransferase [Anaerolineae bacterium]|nr:glycosyltransferase [Anaerolineae bacterium]